MQLYKLNNEQFTDFTLETSQHSYKQINREHDVIFIKYFICL